MIRNVAIDRLCARLLSAALNLNVAAEGIDGRHLISLAEIEELKHAVDGAASSLNLCSAVLQHCAADLLTPGTTSDDLDKRARAHWEATALTLIHAALAGKNP